MLLGVAAMLLAACGGAEGEPAAQAPATYACTATVGSLEVTYFANDEPALAHFQIEDPATSATRVLTRERNDGAAEADWQGIRLWVSGDEFGADTESLGALSHCD